MYGLISLQKLYDHKNLKANSTIKIIFSSEKYAQSKKKKEKKKKSLSRFNVFNVFITFDALKGMKI